MSFENEFAHGIVFHYFYGGDSCPQKTQGALSGEEFEKILDYYSKDHNIISAETFYERYVSGTINNDDVCITFDDGLECAYEVAFPILKKLGISAFWFIYTLPFEGKHEMLEVYRIFRNSCFASIEDFYLEFYQTIDEMGRKDWVTAWDSKEALEYKDRGFYTPNDRRFRYVRDKVIGKEYDGIMLELMKKHEFDIQANCNNLWINEEQLKALIQEKHVIGLHSHSHPTTMNDLSFEEIQDEYVKNQTILSSICGNKPYTASYPCSAYNDDAISILKNLGIEIAFTARMENYFNNMKIPRIDCATILKEMA